MNTKKNRTALKEVRAGESEVRAYEEMSIVALRNAGYRITMPRVQVIRALADSTKALSAYAIHEKILAGGGKIDVVSVYRILSTLEEVGLIHHVGIADGYFPSRIADGGSRHSAVFVDAESEHAREIKLPDSLLEAIADLGRENALEFDVVKLELKGRVVSKGRK